MGALLFAVVLGGCKGSVQTLPDIPVPARVFPKYLAVKTPGVEIYPEDRSWIVTAGTQIVAPFKSDQTPYVSLKKIKPKTGPVVHKSWTGKNRPPDNAITDWDSKAEARRAARNSIFVRVFFEWVPRAPTPPVYLKSLRSKHKEWLAKGGRPVRIKVPNVDRPLFGVLVLSSSVRLTGKNARLYRIKIPEKDVKRVLEGDGRIALISNPYTTGVQVKGTRFGKPGPGLSIINEVDFYTKPKVRGVTWLLWISTEPLG